MIQKYFQKRRDKLFPKLAGQWNTEDFKERILPALKNMNVNNMSHQMWFFFHPTAYTLMYWGCTWVVIISSLIPFIYGLIVGKTIMTVSFGFLIVIMLINHYKRWKMREVFPPKGYTFYDNWIKKEEEY